jgi:hypothetical protein
MSKTCIIFLDANHQDAYNLEKKKGMQKMTIF